MIPADAEYGRIKIFTDVNEITRDNVLEVFSRAYHYHTINAQRELYLIRYERGDQPILKREKEVRPEINEKIVINAASQIVDTHVGYGFGNPAFYVQKAKVEDDERKPKSTAEEDNICIATLNKMMVEQGKPEADVELARDMHITGLGYQMVWMNDKKSHLAPFKLSTLNPLTTFVVYRNDAWREPIMGVTYFIHEDGTVEATAYTDKWCFTIRNYLVSNDSGEVGVTPNILGVIPIIEFEMPDRMGVFEKVIPILDELNVVNSDRINSIAQHVQSLLWMHNCMVDEDQKKDFEKGGIICTKSTGEGHEAKIVYLTQTLDQSAVQADVDYLDEAWHEITSTPSWQEASGGSTTGAMQLSNGWQSLEIALKSIEQKFSKPSALLLEAVKAIIDASSKESAKSIKKIDVSDIEIKFIRTKNFDLNTKVNALATMINTGVDPLTSFSTVGLFADAEQAYVDSADIINAIQKKLASENKESNGQARADVDPRTGLGGENNEKKPKIEENYQPSQVAMVENS